MVVSRSGYTTLMDLAVLGLPALIIPTPGQAEQEYLGRLHERGGRFVVQQQEHVDLAAAARQLEHMRPPADARGDALLARALEELGTLLRQ
jgi:UDP-N-acetylglucosamine:LPS N-acetylglucosamine transferase